MFERDLTDPKTMSNEKLAEFLSSTITQALHLAEMEFACGDAEHARWGHDRDVVKEAASRLSQASTVRDK